MGVQGGLRWVVARGGLRRLRVQGVREAYVCVRACVCFMGGGTLHFG